MKYHIKGIGKNKKIKEQRKKPLPIRIMKNETKLIRIDDGRNGKSPFLNEII